MIINDLPSLAGPAAGDEIPIERGTATYKIDYDALASAILNRIGAGNLSGSPSLLVNLGSTNAASVMQANPRPGINGVLDRAHGGTGLTASPSMLVNLASTTATNVLQANPRPGITGVLDGTHGGTGMTASPSMLVNLSSTVAANILQANPRPGVTGVLDNTHGGTGMTASPSMLVNLASASAANVLQESPRPGVTGVLGGTNGGTGTSVAGCVKVTIPSTPDALEAAFTSQPLNSIAFIPGGTAHGSVIGPDGNPGDAGWFVISYKYSASLGYQWGFNPGNRIYVRQYANGAWSGWRSVLLNPASLAMSPASAIHLDNSTHNTWAKVYAALSELEKNRTASIYIDSNVGSTITNGAITGKVLFGTVTWVSENVIDFILTGSGDETIYLVHLTGVSSNTRTAQVYDICGTMEALLDNVYTKAQVDTKIDAAKPVIEVSNISSFTVPANGMYSLYITHNKAGYTSWFLNYIEYRSTIAWNSHIKDITGNSATLDIINPASSSMTVTTAKAAWLCMPN